MGRTPLHWQMDRRELACDDPKHGRDFALIDEESNMKVQGGGPDNVAQLLKVSQQKSYRGFKLDVTLCHAVKRCLHLEKCR